MDQQAQINQLKVEVYDASTEAKQLRNILGNIIAKLELPQTSSIDDVMQELTKLKSVPTEVEKPAE